MTIQSPNTLFETVTTIAGAFGQLGGNEGMGTAARVQNVVGTITRTDGIDTADFYKLQDSTIDSTHSYLGVCWWPVTFTRW